MAEIENTYPRQKGRAADASSLGPILRGQRVIVIGGGGDGNGRGIVRAVAGAGAQGVAVVDVDQLRATEAANEIISDGTYAVALRADVRSAEQLKDAVGSTVASLGGIDVLITVVGGFSLFAPFLPTHATQEDSWDKIFDLNLKYVFLVVRSVIEQFLAQGTGGSIVSVGSLVGSGSAPMSVAYGAAKAGLSNLARTVSNEYGEHGIRMNVVNCGIMLTPAVAEGLGEERVSTMVKNVPLGRGGLPEELGSAVAFLASPLSSYISGQTIGFDGGASAHSPLPTPRPPV
jgi:3-oxoacyl-[acyl-carrier protein] reductase